MGLTLLLAAALAAAPVPMHHGVVFFCPEDTAEAIRQLEAVRADGFDLIKFCSWVWTIPKAGSPLEARASAVLDWCDQHQVAFFLLHGIQYGRPGEGGGLDQQALDPAQTLPLVRDWARVLKGHPCVMGVILGNEVEPLIGSPEKTPRWWAGFLQSLRAQWGDIGRLNRAWGTAYPRFAAIDDPARAGAESPDLRHYAIQRFAAFYGMLFD
ncbi:MAG: hypothetical protein HYU66_19285 [Armatimonadetes bacterium]|nr:hypothetical protein [Armatimonadota bacterium]